jgi:hypothetical protein
MMANLGGKEKAPAIGVPRSLLSGKLAAAPTIASKSMHLLPSTLSLLLSRFSEASDVQVYIFDI